LQQLVPISLSYQSAAIHKLALTLPRPPPLLPGMSALLHLAPQLPSLSYGWGSRAGDLAHDAKDGAASGCVGEGGSQFSVSASDGTWDASAAPPVVKGRGGAEESAGYEVALRKVCSYRGCGFDV
jgi:hypothetical protein